MDPVLVSGPLGGSNRIVSWCHNQKTILFCESGSLVVLGPIGGWVTIEDLKSERRGGYCTKDESKSYPRPKQANSPKMTTFQRK